MKTAAHEALEQVALDEYRAHLGKCLEVDYICGYNDTDDSGDYECIPPLIVRVVKTDTSSILHWNCSHNDDWLDPYWDVEVVSGKLPRPDLRSLWIDGPSHHLQTGKVEFRGVRPLTAWQSIKARIQGALS